MKKVQPANIISTIALCTVFSSIFGGGAMAQAVSPVAEASPGIAGSDILIIIASLALVAFLAMPYLKKPDDKSKSGKK